MYIVAFNSIITNNKKNRELHKNIKKRIDINHNIKKEFGKESKEYKESDKILKDLQKKYIELNNTTYDDDFDFN